MNETDYAWAAGFIDGEGAVGIEKTGYPMRSGRTSFTGRVVATQIVRAPLDKLQQLFGGTIYRVRNQYGTYWAWRTRGDGTERCLRAVLPYLMVKRQQVECVLAFKATVDQHDRGRGNYYGRVSDETYSKRLALYATCKALNRHDVHAERLSERAPRATEEGATVRAAGNTEPAEATEMVARLSAS